MWMFLQRFCVRGGVGRLGGEGQGGREDQKANTKILWNTNQYIYIYIYEMGSSYIWCNSTKVTLFLNRRFLKNLMVRKSL